MQVQVLQLGWRAVPQAGVAAWRRRHPQLCRSHPQLRVYQETASQLDLQPVRKRKRPLRMPSPAVRQAQQRRA